MTTSSKRAQTMAGQLGHRAGRRFRVLGIPTPLPRALQLREDLAAAWRRGYLAELRPPRRPRG